MFGGLSFMLGGNMCCGIIGDDLVVRAGPDSHEKSLANRTHDQWTSPATRSKEWSM